jgi:hypothetical protein
MNQQETKPWALVTNVKESIIKKDYTMPEIYNIFNKVKNT